MQLSVLKQEVNDSFWAVWIHYGETYYFCILSVLKVFGSYVFTNIELFSNLGFFHYILVKQYTKNKSILFYPLHFSLVDDTLIFCDANEDQIRNVKAILICFEAVSGLEINFFKSELIGIRVEESLIRKFAKILGCKVGTFPMT